MTIELIAVVGDDIDALDDYIARFEDKRPPRHEVEAINILLDPSTRAIFIDSITSGCLHKMEEERSKFIDFQEYVWWRLQELKIAAGRRARAVTDIVHLHAKYGFQD